MRYRHASENEIFKLMELLKEKNISQLKEILILVLCGKEFDEYRFDFDAALPKVLFELSKRLSDKEYDNHINEIFPAKDSMMNRLAINFRKGA